MTFIVTTHLMEKKPKTLPTQVAILSQGELVAHGTPTAFE